MKTFKKICFVFLITIFLSSCSTTPSSVYSGSCFEKPIDIDDCQVKAEQGDVGAQFNLGYMYGNGQGVVQDYKEAVKWFTKSAEQGYVLAQFNLGLMYTQGQGVLQDYKESFKWYTKAAEQGHVLAQYNLGVMYYNGQGVIKDYVMAHMYLNIVAVSGDKGAIKNRDLIAKEMTLSQIEKSQDLAREWMRKHQ